MNGPLNVTLVAASLTLAAACVSPSGPASDPLGAERVVISSSSELDEERQAQLRFLPAVEALRDAVEAHEDEEARRILSRLRAMSPGPEVTELLDAFERVLDGRALTERIDLRLIVQERDEVLGEYRLALELVSRDPAPVSVRPAGARLRVAYTSVDPLGSAQTGIEYATLDGLLRMDLEQDLPQLVELVDVTVPNPRGMLAVEGDFRVEFLATELVHEGRSLPANDLRGPERTIVRLAGYIPNGAIEPSELLRYVETGEVHTPALMERTVRIVPSRREETLELLGPLVAKLATPDLQELVPALRWLTGAASPGGDPEAWRKYMAARGSADGGRTGPTGALAGGGALDLPQPD